MHEEATTAETRLTQIAQSTQENTNLATRLQPVCEIALIIIGLYVMYKLLPHNVLGVDAQVRFRAISQLLTQGKMPTMKYSIVGPAFSIPLWLLGTLDQTPLWWCERYNLVVFAVGLLALYWLLKNRIDRHVLRKFLLILIVASMFAQHITNYYTEVFTAICVSVGILAIATGRASTRLIGWSVIVLGVVNAPATLLGLAAVVLKHVLDHKRLRYILALVAAVGLIVAENWLRRGSLFASGYDKEAGFSFPLIGLLSILFSFGKGLFFFAPGLLLPVRSTILSMKQNARLALYRSYLLWLFFLGGMVLVYSSWWAWDGGWFWGPRFFLFASIPASFALAIRLHYRHAALALNLFTATVFLLSLWVGINGAIYDSRTLEGICFRPNMMEQCLYQPQLSILIRPLLEGIHLSTNQLFYVSYCLVVGGYLLLPLLKTIGEQLIVMLKRDGSVYLRYKTWNF